MTTTQWDAVFVFVLGALVGAGELVSRFRDEPTRAIASVPGGLYMAVNGLASAAALVALWVFGWDPVPDSPDQTRLLQIFAAGFGAMAVFRSALFTVRIGSTDVGVGPVAFLQIMLAAIDRAVDRKRARERAERVLAIMDGLRFADLFLSLPAFAFALLQNLSSEEKAAITEQVSKLRDAQMPEEAKVLNLGLLLMNYVGEGVLKEAVKALRKQLGLPEPGGRRIGLPGLPMGKAAGSSSSDAGRVELPPARLDQVVVEARPPSQPVARPPGSTAVGTAIDDGPKPPEVEPL
jgi:hypothetical protein